jgi:hypothetical protein
MPRNTRARRKRPRAEQPAKAALTRIVAHAADVDVPLAQARDFLHALLVMGYGMIADREDNGEPIVAVVEVAWQRLDAARDAWREVVETARQTANRRVG